MADLIRTAMPGEWDINELLAYNITFTCVPPIQFFPSPNPSLDLDPDLLAAPPGAIDAELSEETFKYLIYLKLAIEKNLTDDLARETLYLLDFAGPYIAIPTGHAISMTVCGKTYQTPQTGVCVVYRRIFVILVVVTESNSSNGTNVEAQVVARAVAAFQSNNQQRNELGLIQLEVMTIPCIIMSGTRPTFYLVPVSQSLSNAVATGQYPSAQTNVLKCITLLGDVAGSPESHASDCIGMDNTDYRKHALQRLVAFKTLARGHWEKIVQDVNNV